MCVMALNPPSTCQVTPEYNNINFFLMSEMVQVSTCVDHNGEDGEEANAVAPLELQIVLDVANDAPDPVRIVQGKEGRVHS